MSVLIKGMEMPTCCAGCCLDRFCKHWDIVPYRHEDCPLVPVPKHGRLIDEKDIVPKDGYIIADGMACIPVKDIINAPTIIPAEEGEA